MSHLGGELSWCYSLSNICSNLLTSTGFDAASAIHSHHHHFMASIPRNKSSLDFGDQAAHGARNEQPAADAQSTTVVGMNGFSCLLWSYNIMWNRQPLHWIMCLIFLARTQFVVLKPYTKHSSLLSLGLLAKGKSLYIFVLYFLCIS